MTYVVRMNGEKVRSFNDLVKANEWAAKHCRGIVKVTPLYECKGLPRACSKIYPNEDLPKLVYKPFVALA